MLMTIAIEYFMEIGIVQMYPKKSDIGETLVTGILQNLKDSGHYCT